MLADVAIISSSARMAFAAYAVPQSPVRVNGFRSGSRADDLPPGPAPTGEFEHLGCPRSSPGSPRNTRPLPRHPARGFGQYDDPAARATTSRVRECNIVTIEDPSRCARGKNASIKPRGSGSTPTTSPTPCSPPCGYRRLLVGEMRDQETVAPRLAPQETGHLVFSTLTRAKPPRPSTASSTSSRPPQHQIRWPWPVAGGDVCQGSSRRRRHGRVAPSMHGRQRPYP